MVGLRLQIFYEWILGGRKFPAFLSMEIRMFLFFNSLADLSKNISVFFREDLEFIKPDVMLNLHDTCPFLISEMSSFTK